MREIAQAILSILDRGERGAIATVVRTSGSTPQRPGARLLLFADGRTLGTVGGGAVEKAVMDALAACLQNGQPEAMEWDLVRDLGMCCGGRMEVFVEPIEPKDRLFIFGAGHVAGRTARLARDLGFAVTVIDEREALNTEERFPECDRIHEQPAEATRSLGLTDRDWVLILTHDHRLDEEALGACLRVPHRYIGLIGSRRKVFRVLSRIQAKGGLPSLDRVHAPVGIDIGAVTPDEIAVSIVGELVAVRRGVRTLHLRALDHPLMHKLQQGTALPEDIVSLEQAPSEH
ncbi:MAG: XdhC family protein [Deltaproteobacteria bacterium]|nr:XdhC family protein [Deltaproteobacteria bacterium]